MSTRNECLFYLDVCYHEIWSNQWCRFEFAAIFVGLNISSDWWFGALQTVRRIFSDLWRYLQALDIWKYNWAWPIKIFWPCFPTRLRPPFHPFSPSRRFDLAGSSSIHFLPFSSFLLFSSSAGSLQLFYPLSYHFHLRSSRNNNNRTKRAMGNLIWHELGGIMAMASATCEFRYWLLRRWEELDWLSDCLSSSISRRRHLGRFLWYLLSQVLLGSHWRYFRSCWYRVGSFSSLAWCSDVWGEESKELYWLCCFLLDDGGNRPPPQAKFFIAIIVDVPIVQILNIVSVGL